MVSESSKEILPDWARRTYIMDGDEARPCRTMQEVTASMNDCRIGKTTINGVDVSTVFLRIDHSYDGGTPVLWETMTFGGECDQQCWRYTSRGDARRGHERIVDALRNGTDPNDNEREA